jgi:hypothetical protein
VNHGFARGLVQSFQGNERTRKRELYMMLVGVGSRLLAKG